jgi:thiol-disulfide isomerase/thioredoxin
MLRKTGLACLVFALASCHRAAHPAAVGTWRAVLTSPGGELPFTLRIVPDGAALRAVIVNGSEQVHASGVDINDSSITIRFDVYDSAINATFSTDGSVMTGAWTRTVPAGTCRMAFRATRGKQPRFLPIASVVTAPSGEMNGIWKAEFTDYRLTGDYWSRDSYHTTWTATRADDAGATLPDGWKDVGLTNSEGRFRFRFPDLAGKPVALSDERFRGKVVLVNIFGSWCPNCNDEAPLLAAWDRKYRHRGLEIGSVLILGRYLCSPSNEPH